MKDHNWNRQYTKKLRGLIGVGQTIIENRDPLIYHLFSIFYGVDKKVIMNWTQGNLASWLNTLHATLEDCSQQTHKKLLDIVKKFQKEFPNQFDILPDKASPQDIFINAKEILIEVLSLKRKPSIFYSDDRQRDVTDPYHLEVLLLFVFVYAHTQKLWLSTNFMEEILCPGPDKNKQSIKFRSRRDFFRDRKSEDKKRKFLVKDTSFNSKYSPILDNIEKKYPKKKKKIMEGKYDPKRLISICGRERGNSLRLTNDDKSDYFRFEQPDFFSKGSDEIIPGIQKLFCSLSMLLCLWLTYLHEEHSEDNPNDALEVMAPLLFKTIDLKEDNKKALKIAQEVEPEPLILIHEFYDEIPEKEVIEKHCQLYQAEELQHSLGYPVKDENALNKKAWYANLSELWGHIIFGPYKVLPELGDYVAFFKIKIDDNSSREPILLLDVIGGGNATRIIRGTHFLEPNKYQLFGVKFECNKIERMEYRAWNQSRKGKIWIDYIAIVKLPLSIGKDQKYAQDLQDLIGIGKDITKRVAIFQELFSIFYGWDSSTGSKSFSQEHFFNHKAVNAAEEGWIQRFKRKVLDKPGPKLSEILLKSLYEFQEAYWIKLMEVIPDSHPFKQDIPEKCNFFGNLTVTSGTNSLVKTIFEDAEKILWDVLKWQRDPEDQIEKPDEIIFKRDQPKHVEKPPYYLELLLVFFLGFAHQHKFWISNEFIEQVLLVEEDHENRPRRDQERALNSCKVYLSEERKFLINDLPKKVNESLKIGRVTYKDAPWHHKITLTSSLQYSEKDEMFYRFEREYFWERKDTPLIQKLFCSLTTLLCIWFAYKYSYTKDPKYNPSTIMEPFLPRKTQISTENRIFTLLEEYLLQDHFRVISWQLPDTWPNKIPFIPKDLSLYNLPQPINSNSDPDYWLQEWQKKWHAVITPEEEENWLKNHLSFLFNGIRGLSNSCLSDVLLTVPPLVSMFNPLWHSLEKNRRAAVFSASGMGKSRIILYLAAVWKKEFPNGKIFLCESPSSFFEDQWIGFEKFLDYLTQRIDKIPVLLIFEDLHQKGRANEKIEQLIPKRFVSNTFWLGSYTTSRNLLTLDEEILEDIWFDPNYKREHIRRISQGWNKWKPFFKAWCHWIDDTTDYKIPLNINWETITSPWEVTLRMGLLRQKIHEYFQKCTANKPIYWLHVALFLLHDEKPVPVDELLYVLQRGLDEQKELLKQTLGGNEQDWKSKLIELIDEWERPSHLELPFSIRLLPPRPPQNTIYPKRRIDFFHQKLADELWAIDSQELEQILEFLKYAYIGLEQALEIFPDKENDKIITYADKLRCFTIQNRKIIGIDLSNFRSVSDITPLESCENIEILDLNWTKVADMSILRSFKDLQELYLNRTEVIDFSALDYCENIKVLTLNRTEISDLELIKLSTLKFWKKLRELRLAGTKISDITPLKFCSKIQVLDLSITDIKETSPLKHCKDLRILILNWTQVSTVDTLTSCKNLRILDITGAAVKDHCVLQRSIKKLRIYSSKVEEAKIKIRVLIATIGSDQYDKSAPIVVRLLKDVGMEAKYIGLINTPEEIVERVLREEVDVIGLSFLAIPKFNFIPKLMKLLREKELTNVLVIAGGNIPKKEGPIIKNQGIAEVFFPNTPPLAIPKFIRENTHKKRRN